MSFERFAPYIRQKSRYIYYLIMGLALLAMIKLTWCRFGNLIIDTFRDQVVAEKLAHGAILYKDVYYLFGILSPYILAALNKLFGVSLYCSIFLGVAVTIVCGFFLYRISRLFLDRLFSTLTVLTFFLVSAFNDLDGFGIFNFILPYSLASYLAVAFFLAALYFFLRFARDGNIHDIEIWSAACCLMFLTRIDFTIPPYALFAISAIVLKRKQFSARLVGCLLFPPTAAFFAYAAYLIPTGSLQGFYESVVRMFLFQGTGNDPFTIFVFGAYERFGHTFVLSLRHSLSVMSVTFLLQTGAMAVLYAAGLACYRLEPSVSRYGWISRTSLYVIFALLSIGLIKMILPGGKMLIINNYTSVPLILVAGALISAWLLRGGSKEYILSIILFTFSLLFLTRVLLRANVIFYGNYLLVPSLACISVFYINILPKGLDSFFGGRGGAKTYYCLACAVYLVMTALPFFQYNLRVYSSKIVMTVTERGTLRTANYRPNVVFWQMVDFIKNNTPADGRLVVIPEGNGINYFSGRPSPIKYEQFIPNVLRSIGEARMVKELNDAAIDYIVLTQRYTPEYGYPCFGVDYGKAVMSWINDNYEVVKVIGDKPYAGKGGYGMAIYRKKWNCPLTMETKANCGETASD